MKKFVVFLFSLSLIIGLCFPALAQKDAVIVVSYAGDVKVFPPGETKSVVCEPGMILKEGTRIVTGKEAYMMLALDRPGRNLVKVKAGSEVVIKLGENDKIELIDGKVFTLLRELDKGSIFRIRTPDAVCGARGTGWGVWTEGNVTTVAVFDRTVFVRGITKDGSDMEGQVWVEEGYQVQVKRYRRPGKPIKLSDKKLNDMKKEFGLDTQAEIREKLEGIEQAAGMREKQIESIQERRDERRIDEKQDKRQQDRRGGGMKTIRR